MKRSIIPVLAFVLVVCLSGCPGPAAGHADERAFYSLVADTQAYLDRVADDIYLYWYDCIYQRAYRGDINYAIACALQANRDNIAVVEENTQKIRGAYAGVRNGDCAAEVRAVMAAYDDYYVLVMEESGTFYSYSSDKVTCKRALTRALKDLMYVL